jgi:hypothetical protein
MTSRTPGNLGLRNTSGSVEDSSFKLLRFFRKYPHAWFNRLAVVQALEYRDLITVENALNGLVKDGKISTRTCNNLTIYRLAEQK